MTSRRRLVFRLQQTRLEKQRASPSSFEVGTSPFLTNGDDRAVSCGGMAQLFADNLKPISSATGQQS